MKKKRLSYEPFRQQLFSLFIAFVFFLVPVSSFAADYYVKTPANGGDNGNAGTSWDSAKATIQAAIDLAVTAGDRVLVAAGTYNERITFPAHNTFTLSGGYPADGGTQDPWNNATIIDGSGLSGSVVTYPGIYQTVRDIPHR